MKRSAVRRDSGQAGHPGRDGVGDRHAVLLTHALIVGVLTVAVVYFGRPILLPMAIAVLLSFVLTPVAGHLERLRIGRIEAVIVTVVFAFALFGGAVFVLGRQATDLVSELPSYEENLKTRVRLLRGAGGKTLSDVAQTVEKLEAELSEPKTAETARPQEQDSAMRSLLLGSEPISVQVVDSTPLPLRLAQDWLGSLLAPLGSAAMVLVFVIFMLLYREDMSDRLIRLAGTSHLCATTEVLNDAGQRVSRYLLMQLAINAIHGTVVGLGLWALGLPNAFLWGLLAGILRFVPYIGPWMGAAGPILLSLAVFPGWTSPALTIGLFVVLELIINNVLEPLMYGSSAGVTPLGIIAAAVFWAWAWGPAGLILSTPLTVCLIAVARHVPQLHFLIVLMASESPLEPHFRFYQRLLALDDEGARAVLENRLREDHAEDVHESILFPTLVLAEQDRDAGRLDPRQQRFLAESIPKMVADLQSEGRVLNKPRHRGGGTTVFHDHSSPQSHSLIPQKCRSSNGRTADSKQCRLCLSGCTALPESLFSW